MRILRPELIAGYAEYLRLKTLTSNEAKRKAENPNATEEEKAAAAENDKVGMKDLQLNAMFLSDCE